MWHSAFELILTFVLLLGVTTVVRLVVGPSPISRAFPQIHVELLIVGAAVCVLLTGLIKSPLGKISGGHTNPAISLAMWRFGVFPAAGIIPYVASQLLGSVLGVVAARAVWGRVVEQPPVLYAVIQPVPSWSAAPLFLAEAVGMAVIVFTVGYFLSVPRLAPFVPWLVGILVGLGIAMLGTQTGGSLNPARQFGPAGLWTYRQALGVLGGSNGRGRGSSPAAQDCSTPPPSTHAQIMWHSGERGPIGRRANGVRNEIERVSERRFLCDCREHSR
jgi:glycerol uptake facilitator protein/aquaporin Z